MSPNEFTALMGLVKTLFVSIWAMLDSVVIVNDSTYRLSVLGFGLSAAFLVIIAKAIQKLRTGSSENLPEFHDEEKEGE